MTVQAPKASVIITGVFPTSFLLLSFQILIEVKKTFEKQPSMVEITVPEVSCVFVVACGQHL